jgi:hypothetical protein
VKLLDKCSGRGRGLSLFLPFADAIKSGRANILLLDIACIVEWDVERRVGGVLYLMSSLPTIPHELVVPETLIKPPG